MSYPEVEMNALAQQIKQWAMALGFQQAGITDTKLTEAEHHLHCWLEQGHHGEMHYMSRHGLKRSRPDWLHPGTIRVISVRMDYQTDTADKMQHVLVDPYAAYVSRYALGRDYHKLMRHRLQKLVEQILVAINYPGSDAMRVFVDSAPVLEKALAEKAGLGWIGKHSNLINRKAGSWFFLGEIYTNLPLPVDQSATAHCGQCEACMTICPSQAIIAPYQVDARRCISYLTIELQGSIPEDLRALIGNRIYGCDDCQLICPWNRFAKLSAEADFTPRYQLNSQQLLSLFGWTEAEFLVRTEGSAIRRVGYQRWLRNIAVALGNAPKSVDIKHALERKLAVASDVVQEHIDWALKRQNG